VKPLRDKGVLFVPASPHTDKRYAGTHPIERSPENILDMRLFWIERVPTDVLNGIISRLIELTNTKHSEAARIRASEILLSYRLGKPPEVEYQQQHPTIHIEHNVVTLEKAQATTK
jgi:hypothetical protein